ncbi:hypothetical protein TSH58p_31950 (plasmid) [Azospirillum sp. TSH58]|uniref:hypothetical protein n=1 Tax=Azospirillum sp. TSH58 TaxID=664962 RepID=UPI000D6007CA|nr:hypothetical protein [Azospirillum sp. TSH58]AWJ88097.1 hypothetical protein TSH58p_31950 [Azospirillum sp. TSH58]PWC72582.1 hypothetical protein TSH58_08135 [Azospirillum sp. TSH58]
MPPLHLIADDLTGALDSAAAFAGPARPVAVHWDGVPAGLAAGVSVALDTGTRDIGDAAAARRRVTALATRLPAGGGCCFLLKIFFEKSERQRHCFLNTRATLSLRNQWSNQSFFKESF